MTAEPKDRKANRRGAARLAAVQALYQMDIAATPLNDILAEFESHWIGREVEGSQYLPAEAAFFRSIVRGVLDDQRTLDPMIDKALAGGWPLKRVEALLLLVDDPELEVQVLLLVVDRDAFLEHRRGPVVLGGTLQRRAEVEK